MSRYDGYLYSSPLCKKPSTTLNPYEIPDEMEERRESLRRVYSKEVRNNERREPAMVK